METELHIIALVSVMLICFVSIIITYISFK